MASVSRCSYSAAASAAATAAAAAPRRRAVCPRKTARVSSSLLTSPAAPASPILDFLLPSFAFRSYGTSPVPASQPATTLNQSHPRRQLASSHSQTLFGSRRPLSSLTSLPCSGTRMAVQPSRRCFSTSPRRQNTKTLLNPQMDDDGNEMRLELTARAAKRLSKVMAKDGNPRLALRIQVESGGCHGFQYLMSLVTLPDQLPANNEASAPGPDGEPMIREDDTIFTFETEDAPLSDPLSAPKIILDTPSLELLNGSKVDFTMELIGSQFKIVDNPLASSSCGCGTSFDIKV
ncbi:iron-sulfur cluster assembly accessory protein [Ophiostoma piceae UAMH 11346]|uniref:Iron-sulfur cluster assembly accessory protein n=1 Tax=Ophiostoma piceae (strain UAMH 11346) TaxID=1262450 RepID=S3C034_OPHP1|nr:iron-sulfur cluster assembly accessory protein [Ophiostoma piceae UAMH 11346]